MIFRRKRARDAAWLLDVRQKLADARQQRIDFAEAFERLVKQGVIRKPTLFENSGQGLHREQELAKHSDDASLVGVDRPQHRLKLSVFHGATVVEVRVGVKPRPEAAAQ